jgi:hypothetical protein
LPLIVILIIYILFLATTATRFRRQYLIYEGNEHEMDNEKVVKPKEKRKRKSINYKE